MNIDEFIRHSVLPKMQITSVYFKPDIPQNKLANAIREYAPKVGMSTVVVLLDESFWGNGKEGMIITNEKIFLSKKFGNQEISLSSVNQIDINEKNLIVNDSPVTKFSKPELMPLGALGSTLNNFIATSKMVVTDLQEYPLVDDSITKKLTEFLSRITEPLFFDSCPADRRKLVVTTTGYVLASGITEEQNKLLRFKGRLSSREVIICASWLDSNDSKDEFFCVTNCGVYSVLLNKPVVFISHDDLRNLSADEEYKESRYIGLRLSNGQGVIVSIQNGFIRPYGYELFAGLINILNGCQPEDRINSALKEVHGSSEDETQVKKHSQDNNIKEQPPKREPVKNHTPYELNFISGDEYFSAIKKIDNINKASSVASIFLGDSNKERPITKITDDFTKRVYKSVFEFRKIIVEQAGVIKFANDLSTIEVECYTAARILQQLLKHSVPETLLTTIIETAIPDTLFVKSEKMKNLIISVIKSYIQEEEPTALFTARMFINNKEKRFVDSIDNFMHHIVDMEQREPSKQFIGFTESIQRPINSFDSRVNHLTKEFISNTLNTIYVR